MTPTNNKIYKVFVIIFVIMRKEMILIEEIKMNISVISIGY